MSDSENDETQTNKNKEDVDLSIKVDETNSNFIEHKRISLFTSLLNDKQMDRYGEFKRSSIENRKRIKSTNKIEYPRIKKIIQNVLGENVPVSNSVQIVMHGIAKIYAGELIEEAKKILFEETDLLDNKPKPIKPKHLREARRRFINRGLLPGYKASYPLLKN